MPFFVNFGYSRQGETKEAEMIDVHQNKIKFCFVFCFGSRNEAIKCSVEPRAVQLFSEGQYNVISRKSWKLCPYFGDLVHKEIQKVIA